MKSTTPKSNQFQAPRGRIIAHDENSSVFRIVPRLVEVPITQVGIASTSTPEDSKALRPDTTVNTSPCVPPSTSFNGTYGFTTCFEHKAENKKLGWIYSESMDKLYVAKDLPCPINFRTERPPPSNAKIRVVAVFAQPENVNEVVRRCINHSFIDLNNGVFNPDHLIRCECDQAVYETDDITDRRSVILPYEHPSRGQLYSTYIFRFMCFGSCAGGLNRRPIRVIFTLEVNNQVVGRRSLDVKICASPWRDAKHENDRHGIVTSLDETTENSLKEDLSKKRKKKDNESPFNSVLQFVKEIAEDSQKEITDESATKKSKMSPQHQNGTYAIIVHDAEEYEFLKQVKNLYELTKAMQSVPPELLKYLKSMQKRKRDMDS